MRKQYTAEQREKLIAEVRATGETVRVVATRLGVTPSSAYLWMKGAATPAPSPPVFARVVPARARSLRVDVGGAALVVERGFDVELLRQIVAALSGSP
jgi:transposase-like protein